MYGFLRCFETFSFGEFQTYRYGALLIPICLFHFPFFYDNFIAIRCKRSQCDKPFRHNDSAIPNVNETSVEW